MKKLSKKQRAAVCEAFKEAKGRLWDGGSKQRWKPSAICYAIGYNTEISRMATMIISSRLGDYTMVPHWLRLEARIPEKQLTTKNVQAYRHAWLDALIEEFSS